MAMIAWPVVIGGLAVFATAPLVQVIALPLLLLSWIGCMRLALTISTNLPSRRTQLGASLLVALGLLLKVCICVRVAALAGLPPSRWNDCCGSEQPTLSATGHTWMNCGRRSRRENAP